MVWTSAGWIDQGEDPADLYEDPVPLFCYECGAKIDSHPQVITYMQQVGPEDYEPREDVWWECPRCMKKYCETTIEFFNPL